MAEQPIPPRPRFRTIAAESAIPIEADDLIVLAREEIQAARKLNPFDRGLAEISGRVEFELKNFDHSLDEFVDAFLLATDQKGETTEPVRRMINTLKRMKNLDNKDLNARINS